MLISRAVVAWLICAFVYACAQRGFSHDAAQMLLGMLTFLLLLLVRNLIDSQQQLSLKAASVSPYRINMMIHFIYKQRRMY